MASQQQHVPKAGTATALEDPSTIIKSDAGDRDLELCLLQSFGTYASEKLVSSYVYMKNTSRLAWFLANTTEKFVTSSGLATLVEIIFRQYQRIGHPWLHYVDEAMGRRIIDVFVNILLLANEHEEGCANSVDTLEEGKHQSKPWKLTYQERITALLHGEIPRLEAMLEEAKRRDQATQMPTPPPSMVMDLKDFVPVDEIRRLKDENKVQVHEMNKQLSLLREQMNEVVRDRQRLEQDLTDVHNYQESERGQRFREMEEELARTKLEANQKAHDLRRLELVIEAMRRKRKGKGSRSGPGRSTASEDPPSPNKDDMMDE